MTEVTFDRAYQAHNGRIGKNRKSAIIWKADSWWKSQRKATVNLFKDSNLNAYIPTIISVSNKLMLQWSNQSNYENNQYLAEINGGLLCWSLDIIGKIAFNYEFNSLDNPNNEFTRLSDEFLEMSAKMDGKSNLIEYIRVFPAAMKLSKEIKKVFFEPLSS